MYDELKLCKLKGKTFFKVIEMRAHFCLLAMNFFVVVASWYFVQPYTC